MNLKYLESFLHVFGPCGKSGALNFLILLESRLLKCFDNDDCSNIESVPHTWPPKIQFEKIILLSMMLIIAQTYTLPKILEDRVAMRVMVKNHTQCICNVFLFLQDNASSKGCFPFGMEDNLKSSTRLETSLLWILYLYLRQSTSEKKWSQIQSKQGTN